MFIDYSRQHTFIHRLDIRTKMIGFTSIVILSFLFENPLYNLVITLFTGLLAFSIKMPFKKLTSVLAPLAPIFILIMLLSGFTYTPNRFDLEINQTVLFYLLPGQRLGATVGGLMIGCNFLLRLFTMVVTSSVLVLTTPIDDFVQFLNKMKVPNELSFIITTAIRFIPTLDKKRMLIIDAQKARGTKLNEKGIIGQLKTYIPIMIPMIINSILMANTLSIAMLNRGYGYTRSWTNLREIKLMRRDYYVIFLIVSVTVIGLYLSIVLNRGIL